MPAPAAVLVGQRPRELLPGLSVAHVMPFMLIAVQFSIVIGICKMEMTISSICVDVIDNNGCKLIRHAKVQTVGTFDECAKGAPVPEVSSYPRTVWV